MLQENIKSEIKKKIKKFPLLRKSGVFLFGSSIKEQHFHDIDIGVIDANERDISALSEEFEESIIPYKIDIVNFSHVSAVFKNKIFRDGVVWLTPQKK